MEFFKIPKNNKMIVSHLSMFYKYYANFKSFQNSQCFRRRRHHVLGRISTAPVYSRRCKETFAFLLSLLIYSMVSCENNFWRHVSFSLTTLARSLTILVVAMELLVDLTNNDLSTQDKHRQLSSLVFMCMLCKSFHEIFGFYED